MWVECEGSDYPTQHSTAAADAGTFLMGSSTGTCNQCGQVVACDDESKALPHERDDVVARSRRGDYD